MNNNNSNVLINNLIKVKNKNSNLIRNVFLVLSGVVLLSFSAQATINLPFTIIPITLQNFSLFIIVLLFGKKLGLATITSYITAGTLGAPIFANFGSGPFFLRPSGGYLIGFFFAVLFIGILADKGITKSHTKTFITLILAALIINFFGASFMAMFMPMDVAIKTGIVPFLLGDFIKILVIFAVLPKMWKFVK